MTEKKEGKIGCKCGKAEITIADGTAIHRIFCACEDCRQALEWASLNGAEQPDTLPDLYYLPSDILAWKGEDYMRAVKLREDGRAIRVFCKNCFSMIAADHPAFHSNVLQPMENIPVFHTLKYNEERKRWVNLPATSRALCPRTEAPVGQTLTEFLQKLEPIEVLSLSRGETLI